MRLTAQGAAPMEPLDIDSFYLNYIVFHFFLLQYASGLNIQILSLGLNKNDKIGEVGGRSFYLCKNRETTSSFSGTENNLVINQRINILSSVKTQAVNTSELFMSFIIKKFNKIKRRTIRVWRFVTCS
jgi:hypothetical protein